MSDAIWWTGALVWFGVVACAAVIVGFVGWRAIYATAEVCRQLWLHHITRRRTKAEWNCTPGEAWLYAFREGPEGRQ